MSAISNKLSYKTVKERGRDTVTIKKSKFIATCAPCATENEAIDFVNEIRKEFPDATHNVYAYCIDENNIFRYTDDGEPSQTAGMPVLDVMRHEELVDTAIVVTRYFGGTLLGTGGLVHAYSSAAKIGLNAAKIIMRKMCNIISINADYSFVGKIQHLTEQYHYVTDDVIYTERATFFICVPPEETEAFIKKITEETNARAICTVIDRKYIDTEA